MGLLYGYNSYNVSRTVMQITSTDSLASRDNPSNSTGEFRAANPSDRHGCRKRTSARLKKRPSRKVDLLSAVLVCALFPGNSCGLSIESVLIHALGVNAVPGTKAPVDDFRFNRFCQATQ